MKRLLCLLSSMDAGGAEGFLMKLYRALDRSQYQMDFCVNVEEPCLYDAEIERLSGRIFRIPPKSASVPLFRKQLAAIVRENGYDYVLRVTSNAMGFMDLMIAKRAGAKTCVARSSNSSDGGGAKSRLAHIAGSVLYGRCVDVKLAPSDLAAKYTFGEKAYQNGEVHILRNALDLDTYRFDPAQRTAIRAALGISDNAPVIGHIGRFSPQKNHSFLLDVFASIKTRTPDAVLLLVGKGELEAEIRDRAAALHVSDSVIFTGVRVDVPALLSAMDVFVFPSLYEGMPNTVIEAQATGLPCVIADTVTREADITGLVRYLPLEKPERWADEALSALRAERIDTRKAFIDHGYDIESVVGQFTKLVFEERKNA